MIGHGLSKIVDDGHVSIQENVHDNSQHREPPVFSNQKEPYHDTLDMNAN